MRYLRIVVVILAIAVTLLRIVLFIAKSDIDVAPTINCDKDVIAVKCSDGDEEILRGVTAFDEQDGDITDKLYVERMYYMVGENKSRVKLVVIDSDNNVTKLTKDVIYTDYKKPEFFLSSDLVFEINDKTRIASLFTAEDCFDGDITNRIRLISNSYNSTKPGVYNLTARVSNTHGDITELNFKMRVISEPFSVKLKLKENLIYVKPGEKIDYKSYLDSGSKRDDIEIDTSELDKNKDKPGCYAVTYSVKEDETIVGFTQLFVVVGE